MRSDTSRSPSTAITATAQADIVDYIPQSQAARPAPNALATLHSLLRGRYPLAFCLAVVGLALGAPMGYVLQKPTYRSIGLISIRSNIPRILYATDQNGPMPMLDAFISLQVAQIQSRRNIAQAMSNVEWRALGLGSGPGAEAAFAQNLAVTVSRGSPLIYVSFSNPDPNVAATAVKVVIDAFEENYNIEENKTQNEPIAALDNVKRALENDLTLIKGSIRGIADDVDPSMLQTVYEHKLSERDELKEKLRNARIQLSLLPTAAPTTAHVAITDAQMMQDARLQQLMQNRWKIQDQLAADSDRLGKQNPTVAEEASALARIDREIERRKQELRDSPLTSTVVIRPGAEVLSRQQLESNVAFLEQEIAKAQAEVDKYADRLKQVDDLHDREALLRKQVEDANSQQARLKVEKENAIGRISVISRGDLPGAPEKDRRNALAVVGGLGLAGLGVGIVMLLGWSDRRMQYIDSARTRLKSVERMLGVLPELPEDLTDPEHASAAAYCVHRIRAMLQLRQRSTGHKIYAITSPAPGDGKTSLTITLGMSLAACGSRTLLIDCDMDGGGLTSRFGHAVRRPLGQILIDDGAIGEAKLQDAIDLAKKKGIKLGKALLELGYVSEQTIRQAIKEQRITAPGFTDVLKGEDVQRAIRTTGYPHLSILPLGNSPTSHSGKLSPTALRGLLDQLVGSFDLILIDCGPILGSIEAAIVSAESDGVVLVVSRGGDRTAAEDAVTLLSSAGAQVEGIVFNRARHEDVASSVFSSSSSARSMRSGMASRAAAKGFGGVESAAAMHRPADANPDDSLDDSSDSSADSK
jgi:Mrp family chromosome partitioning ATPase/uncharacterized protein involved in exopolysaccharide biosynthesis